MPRFFVFLVGVLVNAVRAICRSRADLVIENLALRQQVTALKQQRPRPPLDDADRGFWVALRSCWPGRASRLVTPRRSQTARVVALPRVGGLHHRYEWRDAA